MKAISVDPLAVFLDEDLIQLSGLPVTKVTGEIAEAGIDRSSIIAPVLPVLTSGHRLRPAPEGFVALARTFGVEPIRDLGGADLLRLNLRAQPLEGADLRASDLSDSDLREARLAGSDLSHARCVGTNFAQADLTGADLTGSNLTGADFTGVTMEGAKLSGTVLDPTDSAGVTFSPSELRALLDAMMDYWWAGRSDGVMRAAYHAFKSGDQPAAQKLLARVPIASRPAAALLAAAITARGGKHAAAISLLNAVAAAETAAPTLAALIHALAGDQDRARGLLAGTTRRG